MKGAVHHIELYVSDLGRTSEFWGWFLKELGYEVFQEWSEGISYKLSDTYLVFVQAEDEHLKIGYHRKRIGLNHIAFYAESRTMVDEMTEKLKQRDVELLYCHQHPYAGGKDYYALFFEDPDRIKVELVAPD